MGRRRIALVAVFVMTSLRLHAESPLPNQPGQQSALPWLELNGLAATRDRPLFAPDRRGFAPRRVTSLPPEQPPAVLEPQKTQWALTGIIEGPVGAIILLHNLVTSEFITLHSGENVGRWRIIAETNYTARLISGKEEITLEMFGNQ